MGEGKTTVIAPLLGLLLGDGSQLVLQIVPAPLLSFSLAVLRQCFSSAPLLKSVWTFAFDRRTAVSAELLNKSLTAVSERALMVTTPSAVKAFMLKLIELLHLLDTGQYPRNRSTLAQGLRRIFGLKRSQPQSLALDKPTLQAQAARAVKILGVWRHGVAVIDEVDVVLHPLRSELNWPLGDKHALDFAPVRWELPWHLLNLLFIAQEATAGKTAPSGLNGNSGGAANTGGMTVAAAEENIKERLLAVIAFGLSQNTLQRVPHLTLLSDEFYHDKMRPLLAEWLLLWLRRNGLHEVSDEAALRCLVRGVEDRGLHAQITDRQVRREALACKTTWACRMSWCEWRHGLVRAEHALRHGQRCICAGSHARTCCWAHACQIAYEIAYLAS
eukprot:6208794-Pleurochrysis_carterae.AAC.1